METSKYAKKTSSNYFYENAFDNFDLNEQINKERVIPRCLRDTFLYSSNKINETLDNTPFDIVLFSNKLCGEIKLSDQFEIKKVLGKGSFGCVLEVYDKTIKRIAALKILKNNSKISCSDLNLINLNHVNLPKFYRYFETKNNLFIVMELLEGGSLRDLIEQRYASKNDYLFKEQEIINIYQQIINGLRYLHDQDLIHRDIKPGLSKKIDYKDRTKCGTIIYMAPEQLSGKPYTKSVDIWAAGIILYILCSGGQHPIFIKKMSLKEYAEEVAHEPSWHFNREFPVLARNLFMRMCKYDYSLRLPAFKCLLHPWVSRDLNAPLPLCNTESFKRRNYIEYFRTMLRTSILLHIYKIKYLRKKLVKINANSRRKKSISDTDVKKISKVINSYNNPNSIHELEAKLRAATVSKSTKTLPDVKYKSKK